MGPDLPGSTQSLGELEQERITGIVAGAIISATVGVEPFEIVVDPTWYDPALGGINGVGDYSQTAGGYAVDDWYGNGIACPPEFPFGTVIQFFNHNWTCIDRGGSIVMRGDVARVDVLHRTGVQRELQNALVFLPGVEVTPIVFNPPTLSLPNQPNFICPILSCESILQTVHDDHYGIDLATPSFSSVHSPAPGIVEFAGQDRGCGGSIVIDHGNGWTTRMCHLISVDVATGMQVVAGQAIGATGASGLSDGEHLHIEVVYDGLPRIFTRLIASVPAVRLRPVRFMSLHIIACIND